MRIVGMISTGLFAIGMAVAVWLTVQSIPELRRYMIMKSM